MVILARIAFLLLVAADVAIGIVRRIILMAIRIGTSGWIYNHWRGVFYPPGLRYKEWFRFYSESFDTVEINNSFYRLPSPSMFEAWRTQAPEGFLYSVKASRFLTHMKKLKDPEGPLENFFQNAGYLGRALGPVLYQLPPHWSLNLPRFRYFLSVLPSAYRHVIEFRDASWLTEEVFKLMETYGVAHCIHDAHHLHVPVRVTASPVYIRFHGSYSHGGDYQTEFLESWARSIDLWQKQGLEVFAYFNNDLGGYAPKNARTLKDILKV